MEQTLQGRWQCVLSTAEAETAVKHADAILYRIINAMIARHIYATVDLHAQQFYAVARQYTMHCVTNLA